jgi:hypothetical protein
MQPKHQGNLWTLEVLLLFLKCCTGIPRYSVLHLALFRYGALAMVVQYYAADFSFSTLTFLCNSVSAVSLSALFFWNQLTALSEGCQYIIYS